MTDATKKFGWRPGEWCAATGVGSTHLYELMKKGEVRSVRSGGARIIRTSPAEYLDKLAAEQARPE